MKKVMMMLVVLFVATAVQAALVINFTNTQITANSNMDSAGNDGYSSSSIAPASGYAGPSFFGGSMGRDGTTLIANSVLLARAQTGSPGYLRMTGNNNLDGVDPRINGLTVFNASSSFALGDVNNVYYRMQKQGGAVQADARIVIQVGSSLYASSLTSAGFTLGSDIQNLNSTAFDALSWFNYSPSGTDIYSIGSGVTLDGTETVSAMGLWWEVSASNGDGSIDFAGGGASDFAVDAVPEPATVGMLGLGALVSLMVRRLRK